MAGIYIHIPFCRKACTYCDFHFSTNLSRRADMVRAIACEASLRRDFFGKDVLLDTLYFGGGTPSLLQAEEWGLLLEQLYKDFTFRDGFEFTVECNPDDLTRESLVTLKKFGVNRLSIGVQSLRDQDLELMNRSHRAAQAVTSIRLARETGFENLTTDLIYGIPNLDLDSWQENIEQLVSLEVNHISAYALTVEEQTVLSKQVAKGSVIIPKEETYEAQYFLLIDLLEANGFEHYELSNFALPGYRSLHNSSYWNGTAYLGLGPSSHSYIDDTRSWNLSNNAKYLELLGSGSLPVGSSEVLSLKDRTNEYLMTSLRLSAGADLVRLREEFGYDLEGQQASLIASYRKRGLLVHDGRWLRLTRGGKLLSNSIISDLFLD